MSRKTKAELEAENAWLRSENAIQREQLEDCYEEMDRDRFIIKTIKSAFDDAINSSFGVQNQQIYIDN
jgi:hypothetical protein